MAAERIQPALSSIGINQGGAQILSPISPKREVKPAVPEKKKADLSALKDLQDVQSGIYNINNEARDKYLEKYLDQSINQDVDPAIAYLNLSRELNRLTATEKNIIQPMLEKLTKEGTNYLVYDEKNGQYVPPEQITEFLTKKLEESPEAQEAFQDGTYNQWLQTEAYNITNNAIQYHPDFSLGNSMLEEYKKFTSLPGVAEKSDVQASFTALNEGADLKTVFEEYPDLRDEFMGYLGTRTDLVPKWLDNYAINNSLSPQQIKSRQGEVMTEAMTTMMNEAEGVYLPGTQPTRRMSVVKKSDAERGIGKENEGFKVIITQEDDFDLSVDDPLIETETEKGKMKLDFRNELIKAGAEPDKVKQVRIIPTKKGETVDKININGKQGAIRGLYIDDSGKGVMTLDVEQTVSTPDDATGGRKSTKEIVTEIIGIEPKDVRFIESVYGVNILNPSQESDSTVTNPFE